VGVKKKSRGKGGGKEETMGKGASNSHRAEKGGHYPERQEECLGKKKGKKKGKESSYSLWRKRKARAFHAEKM